MAVGGAALALGAAQLMDRRLGPVVGRPYHEGTTGRLMRASKALTVAGAAGMALGGARRRDVAAASGAALLAGALAERWSIFRAGNESADDPAATVGPQRERRRRRDGR
jgi:hypothetical protein